MKSAFLLVIASLCHGLPLETNVGHTGTQLPAPEKVGLQEMGPGEAISFLATWEKVVSDVPEDPVIGYKAYLWEIKKVKHMVLVNGQPQDIEEEPPIDTENVPDGTPMVMIAPANKTLVFFNNLKKQVSYEVRVKAYTKCRDGPLSSPFRLKLLNKTITYSGTV